MNIYHFFKVQLRVGDWVAVLYKIKISFIMKNLKHRSLGILMLIVSFWATTPAFSQKKSPAHLGIFYPISTHGISAPDYRNELSLHLITGLSGGELGVAAYGIAGIIKGDANGVQASGVWNHLSGTLKGVQLAGIGNRACYAGQGLQFSGVTNLAGGEVSLQMSGILNKASKVNALQAAGVANLTDSIRGLQMAGLANRSKSVEGIQLAGVSNTAGKVKGSQVSGLVNKARSVTGIQLAGLLNIADSSDYPIALINLVKNGEKRIGLSTDENLTTLVSFRSGGAKLYGILGLGSNLQFDDFPYAVEAGLGVKLLDIQYIRMDMEVYHHFVTDFGDNDFFKSGVRLLPVIHLSRNLQLYGGPSVGYTNSQELSGKDFSGFSIWNHHKTHTYHGLQLGLTVGLQVSLQ